MSTRQLRSQLKNAKTGEKRKLDLVELYEGGPLRQRPKRPQVLYHCLTCLDDMPSRSFHNHNPSPDCDHLINTCKKCLSDWVDAQIDQSFAVTDEKENTVFGVKCPECSASMQSSNVRAVASGKMYQVFIKQQRNHLVETTPVWFWFQNRQCRGGAALEDENSKVMTCANCGRDSCVSCQHPTHPGESCDEYKALIKDHVDEEDKSLIAIRRATKPCPGCGTRVEKNGGCDHMRLTQTVREWNGHKAILCLESDSFRKAFTGSFKEAGEAAIEVHDHVPEHLDLMLKYVYKNDYNHKAIEARGSNDGSGSKGIALIMGLLTIADKYDIRTLVDDTTNHLQVLLSGAKDFTVIEAAVHKHYESDPGPNTAQGKIIASTLVEFRSMYLDTEDFEKSTLSYKRVSKYCSKNTLIRHFNDEFLSDVEIKQISDSGQVREYFY
ncbi:hypothetical protein E8E11_000074 [Didymella keratinophila]|nr:hypothetical protein E8E11_000074 [Didymella keratinophila]